MSKPLIMVVDDEKDITDTVCRTIGCAKKYDVVAAHSAQTALQLLRKNRILWGLKGNRIKLILLDIKMPEMDGLQLLAEIRKRYGLEIGVAMLTAWEDEEKRDRASSGFVVDYIKKPFKTEELLAMIEEFFSGHEAKMAVNTMEKLLEKREEVKKEA